MLNRMPSLVFLLLFSFAVSAQSSAEMKADSLALIGMNLMDEGEIAAAIDYLEQAKVIFPGKSTYDYEIGLAHYKGGAYDAALPVLGPCSKALIANRFITKCWAIPMMY